jgi:hypothetical protein
MVTKAEFRELLITSQLKDVSYDRLSALLKQIEGELDE